jgi:uncharacterized protein YgbK (DUF1537 family)
VKGATVIDLLLAYYGDDFTGSTDVLESLTLGGVPTVLFVGPPTDELLDRYPHVRAIGIAGNGRTLSPDEMEATLPNAFSALRRHNPRIVHYKVCSTFDSSPRIGSIGRAIDIGHRVFQNRFVPLVVGAPVLQRFCVFGSLFARSGLDSAPYRLDRHPTMRHHPVTPMTEADLRVHLSQQTNRSIALVDVLALEGGQDAAARQLAEAAREPGGIVLFDTLTDGHLATIGSLVWQTAQQEQKPLFVAGSSGMEYALAKRWQAVGLAHGEANDANFGASLRRVEPVDRTVVVSGSCSPVTERQIAWALAHGFVEVPLDTAQMLQSRQWDADVAAVAKQVQAECDDGRSVIVHTSRGPMDRRIHATEQSAQDRGAMANQLGTILGLVLRNVLHTCHLRRVAVTGGDTSGRVARTLGIDALEMIAPLAPGAPLCAIRSADAAIDGVEITFKGGQVGHDDFFGMLLSG